MVSFGGEFAPFGLAMFAAVCSNRIPVGIVYVATCLGTLIGFGGSSLLSYVLTTLLFIVMMLLFRPKYQEEGRNEKQKLGVYVLISSFVVQAGKMFFTMFLIYDLLTSIMACILTYIFYKIFANSITVIKEYGIKQAFTVEEVIGASLILSIAFYSLNGLNIFGLSISNILSIMLVLFLGWKNGMLVGATSGITIGMVLGIIGDQSPTLVAYGHIFVISPFLLPIFSITTPTYSSGTSIVASSIGSHFTPSMILLIAVGLDTNSSNPSLLMFSISIER